MYKYLNITIWILLINKFVPNKMPIRLFIMIFAKRFIWIAMRNVFYSNKCILLAAVSLLISLLDRQPNMIINYFAELSISLTGVYILPLPPPLNKMYFQMAQ
jgi:hypothetical protein